MSRLTFVALALGVGLLFQQAAAHGQAKFESVNIVTADSVKLKARFYASPMKPAPVVILLHPIGDTKSMDTPEWKSLAEALQKANYSVIMFDFRGHGDSTSIEDPKVFWNASVPFTKYFPNLANVKSKDPKVKDEIYVSEYLKKADAYYPILVNDIAAVRAYLDRRNDNEKDCNTSNIFVIGADNGATLGALWINSEWHRYKFVGDPKYPILVERKKPANYVDCAGADITGAVFLTIQPNLEKKTVKLKSLLNIACKERAMAALFLCGKEDEKALNFNKDLEKSLKVEKSKRHEFIGQYGLATSLSGIKLLQKGLITDKRTTDESIVQYLNSVMEDRKAERVERDFPNTNYYWRYPTGANWPAREKKGDKTLLFDDYAAKFLPK